MDIKAIVNGREFKASIDDSEAGRAFMELLPLRFEMEEMNGNEKCRYLSRKLPTAPEAVGSIESGDIMLFGASCLVLFYDSFATSYSYTRIGRIDDPEGLKAAAGRFDADVAFIKALRMPRSPAAQRQNPL